MNGGIQQLVIELAQQLRAAGAEGVCVAAAQNGMVTACIKQMPLAAIDVVFTAARESALKGAQRQGAAAC